MLSYRRWAVVAGCAKLFQERLFLRACKFVSVKLRYPLQWNRVLRVLTDGWKAKSVGQAWLEKSGQGPGGVSSRKGQISEHFVIHNKLLQSQGPVLYNLCILEVHGIGFRNF